MRFVAKEKNAIFIGEKMRFPLGKMRFSQQKKKCDSRKKKKSVSLSTAEALAGEQKT